MNVGDWVRRLLGMAGGGAPCALCRCSIPASDFRKGRAVVIARQRYCRGCVEEITHRAGPTSNWTLAADTGSSTTVRMR
jgi:hypothetical protein